MRWAMRCSSCGVREPRAAVAAAGDGAARFELCESGEVEKHRHTKTGERDSARRERKRCMKSKLGSRRFTFYLV